jgi:hypothetical protein
MMVSSPFTRDNALQNNLYDFIICIDYFLFLRLDFLFFLFWVLLRFLDKPPFFLSNIALKFLTDPGAGISELDET